MTVANEIEKVEEVEKKVHAICFDEGRNFQGIAWGERDICDFTARIETDAANTYYSVLIDGEPIFYDNKEDFIEDLTEAIEQAMIDF